MKRKQIFSLVLALLMGCSILMLSGCNGGETETTSSGAESGTTSSGSSGTTFDLPTEYNFNGESILIKAFGGYGFAKEGASEISDVEIEWKAAVEKAYNCKLEMETLIPNDTQVSLVIRILGGEKVADVISCHRLDVEKMRISGNLLADLNTLEGLDVSDERWNEGLTEAMTYNGKTYGIFPDRPDIQSGLFFNKDLMESLNLESPYQYVMNKEWTYDKFIEYCEAATSGDRYGVAFDNDALLTMFHNNGMQLITKQEDGTMKYTAYSQENIDTISYLKEKLVTNKLSPEELPITDYHTMFKEGKLLFMTGPDAYMVTESQWGSCDFEVGFLPMPIGPNGTDYSYLLQQWPPVLCVTSTNEDTTKAVALLRAILACEDVTGPMRWDDIENRWFGTDTEGFEIYKMLQPKAYYDWAIYDVGLLDVMYQPVMVFKQAETPIAATMEGDKDRLAAMVDDIYNKNMK
ncbi:MAG: extracellular solute-binding protein [Oscillospiraceae bacterium]|nr:extracellular solute-binding protein [Oscillospiraceae bacterium]